MSKNIPDLSGNARFPSTIYDPATVTNQNAPAVSEYDIGPSDTVAIRPIPREVLCVGAGDITYRVVGDSVDQVLTVTAGYVIPDRIEYIRATGTTVAEIRGRA